MTCITCGGRGAIIDTQNNGDRPCPHCNPAQETNDAISDASPDRPKVLRYEIPARAGKSVGVTTFAGNMIIACEFAIFALNADGEVNEIIVFEDHGS